MKQILTLLQGNKGMIAAIIGTFLGYLAAKGILGEAEIILIGSLNAILFKGASMATKSIVYKK